MLGGLWDSQSLHLSGAVCTYLADESHPVPSFLSKSEPRTARSSCLGQEEICGEESRVDRSAIRKFTCAMGGPRGDRADLKSYESDV